MTLAPRACQTSTRIAGASTLTDFLREHAWVPRTRSVRTKSEQIMTALATRQAAKLGPRKEWAHSVDRRPAAWCASLVGLPVKKRAA